MKGGRLEFVTSNYLCKAGVLQDNRWDQLIAQHLVSVLIWLDQQMHFKPQKGVKS